MSELINAHDNRATIRWKLLTGVSALALTAYVSSSTVAKAEDADRPLIWIELGAQMEQVKGLSAPFIEPFMTATTPATDVFGNDIFNKAQQAARFAFGGEGKLSFQPENSDWIFSAAIRYGRSNKYRHFHQQDAYATWNRSGFINHFAEAPFADVKASEGEHHAILDFTAGKDVGLGAFGHDGTSTISAGVRVTEFSSQSGVDTIARPIIHVFPRVGFHTPQITFYNYTMAAHADRDFHGIGPSISWNASAALAGNKETGEIALDWGINGAVLFGRQKAKLNHDTKAYFLPYTSFYHGQYQGYYYTLAYNHPHQANRSRRATVTNLGGFAGLSWQTEHAKVTIGYRYDTFLGAMDTGIDAAKKSNLTFNGPFASISVGLGD